MTDPVPTPYEQMGGDAGIRKVVDRFYDLMDTAPEAALVRALHAKSLKSSRDKLHLFLTGWTGGPPVYVEKFGHPRLRMRHGPFTINRAGRDRWVELMEAALAEAELPHEAFPPLRKFFHDSATFMINAGE